MFDLLGSSLSKVSRLASLALALATSSRLRDFVAREMRSTCGKSSFSSETPYLYSEKAMRLSREVLMFLAAI